MRAGRPAYHIRSKWITVATPNGIMYFELDVKGNLVSKDLSPSRVVAVQNVVQVPPPVQIPPHVQVAVEPVRPETPVLDEFELSTFGDDFFPFDGIEAFL